MLSRKINDLKNSLFFRLTVLYSLALILVAGVSFLIFYHRIYATTMERMDAELLHEIEERSAVMADSGLEGLKRIIAEDAKRENPREEFYRIVDFQGHTLAATDLSAWRTVLAYDVAARLGGQDGAHEFKTVSLSGGDDRARMLSAVVGPDTILQIGESLEEVNDYLDIFRHLMIVLTVALVIVSATIGWFLARHALIDMQAVTDTAAEITRGAYDRRVQIRGKSAEIQKLGRTFNAMLDRIQNLLRSMKEINDNIAHDLRSPLARIRGIAEMTLTDDRSMDDFRNMAVSTIEECDILIDMINTMLDITEAEAGVSEVKRESFDMARLLGDACELLQPMAAEKKLTLKTLFPDHLSMQGDRKKMQRIVMNVLENAIKYTPENGTVTVTAAAQSGRITIGFDDSGIGISESDLPHIFERFYRCDRSRSQSGVGLGLSLAKAYAESMNGRITVASVPGRGSTFTLDFPSSSAFPFRLPLSHT